MILICASSSVTKDLVVKVGDASLTRDKYPEDYFRGSGMRRSLPVRWMALESLEIDVFTTKGDVVSYYHQGGFQLVRCPAINKSYCSISFHAISQLIKSLRTKQGFMV